VKGLRRVQKPKPPRERPGLDDPTHLAAIRAMPCLIRGKRGFVRKWVGTYPNAEQVTIEVQHVCGPSDPHHVIRKSKCGHDWSAVPLCRSAHDLLHFELGTEEFERIFDVDLSAASRRLRPHNWHPND